MVLLKLRARPHRRTLPNLTWETASTKGCPGLQRRERAEKETVSPKGRTEGQDARKLLSGPLTPRCNFYLPRRSSGAATRREISGPQIPWWRRSVSCNGKQENLQPATSRPKENVRLLCGAYIETTTDPSALRRDRYPSAAQAPRFSLPCPPEKVARVFRPAFRGGRKLPSVSRKLPRAPPYFTEESVRGGVLFWGRGASPAEEVTRERWRAVGRARRQSLNGGLLPGAEKKKVEGACLGWGRPWPRSTTPSRARLGRGLLGSPLPSFCCPSCCQWRIPSFCSPAWPSSSSIGL